MNLAELDRRLEVALRVHDYGSDGNSSEPLAVGMTAEEMIALRMDISAHRRLRQALAELVVHD